LDHPSLLLIHTPTLCVGDPDRCQGGANRDRPAEGTVIGGAQRGYHIELGKRIRKRNGTRNEMEMTARPALTAIRMGAANEPRGCQDKDAWPGAVSR
jgi:hypothetical protein